MRKFAFELRDTLFSLKKMDDLGVKLAEADTCALSQQAVAIGCDSLYDTLYKTAMAHTVNGEPGHMRMITFVEKLAEITHGRPVPLDLQYKLAAAVLADDTLTEVLKTSNDKVACKKFAESRRYGRELVAEFLREALI